MYIKEFQYCYFHETLNAFKVKVEEEDNKNPLFLLCVYNSMFNSSQKCFNECEIKSFNSALEVTFIYNKLISHLSMTMVTSFCSLTLTFG